MARSRDEDILQEAIVAYLHAVVPPPRVILSIPNEGLRSLAGASRMKRMGLRSGACDLLLVVDGRALFLEVKTPKGVVAPNQTQFLLDCDAAGAGAVVVRSIDDVRVALNHWRVATREK